MKTKVSDLHKAYPELSPDKDCPRLRCDDTVLPPKDVIEKTDQMNRPGTRRSFGVLEWPAMRRLADR